MRAFLGFVLRGRINAVATGAVALLVGLFFVTGGIIGLATLRYGIADGVLVLVGSLALASGSMLFLFNAPESAQFTLFIGLAAGVPMLLMSWVLRSTASQGLAVTLAGLLASLFLGGSRLFSDGSGAWWRDVLERVFAERILQRDAAVDAEMLTSLRERFDLIAPLMTQGVTYMSMVLAILTLFLARWCHALLDNPGGFGKEFRALALDHRLAYLLLATATVAILAGEVAGGFAVDLLQILMVLFMLQGLALAHWLVVSRGASRYWLTGMYMVLALNALVAIVALAIVGVSDTWLRYRQRFTV